MKISKKLLITLICALAAVCVTVGGTIAYIFSQTGDKANTFEPVFVSCAVEESFDGEIKSNVIVRNTGDINAYIRASFVVVWVSDSGNIHSSAPKEGEDYTLLLGSAKWTKGSDGFYYYSDPVLPGEGTDLLISSIAPITEGPEGYSLSVHIAATAIQAEPAAAVSEAWGATVLNGGGLTPP